MTHILGCERTYFLENNAPDLHEDCSSFIETVSSCVRNGVHGTLGNDRRVFRRGCIVDLEYHPTQLYACIIDIHGFGRCLCVRGSISRAPIRCSRRYSRCIICFLPGDIIFRLFLPILLLPILSSSLVAVRPHRRGRSSSTRKPLEFLLELLLLCTHLIIQCLQLVIIFIQIIKILLHLLHNLLNPLEVPHRLRTFRTLHALIITTLITHHSLSLFLLSLSLSHTQTPSQNALVHTSISIYLYSPRTTHRHRHPLSPSLPNESIRNTHTYIYIHTLSLFTSSRTAMNPFLLDFE